MNNYNWVCFECRYSKRQSKAKQDTPKCVFCKRELYNIGYKVKIPKKTDLEGWSKIKKTSFERDIKYLEQKTVGDIRQKHEIEKEIVRIEKLNNNKENRRKINDLKMLL